MDIAKIDEQDFRRASELLGVDVATIKAVAQVESGGTGGFLPSGRAVILFEGHIFWRELKRRGIDPTLYKGVNDDILFEHWRKSSYRGKEAEYLRLERAKTIDVQAALRSASWGMFQIMGFNHSLCGVESIELFVEKMNSCQGEQLMLFCQFIRSNKLATLLQNQQWERFATKYNGAGHTANNYAERLRRAYIKQKC